MARAVKVIWLCEEENYFYEKGWTDESADLPDGLSFKNPVQPAHEKYSARAVGQIIFRSLRHLIPLEGRFAIVTSVGMGCGGRVDTLDETWRGGRPSRVVLMSRRWHQPLGSSPEGTAARKPDRRGEHEIDR